MRDLLFLTHRIPYPPNKGDKIRAWHMLDYLRRHFRVHLGCFIDDPQDRQHVAMLQALCASCCCVDQSPRAARLRSLRGLLSGEALSLPYYRDAELANWVAHTLRQHPIATALAFSGPMAQYLPARSRGNPLHRVLDLVDVDSEKWLDYATTQPWPLAALYRREARRLLAFEQSSADQLDAVTLVSSAEADLFRRRAPGAAHKIGHFNNGVDSDYFAPQPGVATPYPERQTVLVFTGAMDYWPNVEAVRWFAWRVLPSLRLQCPALHFYIVGARPTDRVRALQALPGVHVTGGVPDIRPYLQHALAAVAPLRIARGVQNKVLEAMAMEKTVVASPQALEGLSAVAGFELLRADDGAAFIRQLSDLLANPASPAIGSAARQRVLLDYSWRRNLRGLGGLLGVDAHQPESVA